MLTVEASAGSVERRLAAGELSCPRCAGMLAGWGHARARTLRSPGGKVIRLRPRRARCRSCRVTHVLLAVFALARRADTADVIGAALAAAARGAGFRSAAAQLGVPASTVRGWLRCFARRAGPVRAFFTALLAEAGPDPVMPAAAGSLVGDAVAAIAGAASAVAERWPQLGQAPVWQAASAASGGLLLAPGWPAAGRNTS
jgi:transposase-like protein